MTNFINQQNIYSFLKNLYSKTNFATNKISFTKLAAEYNIDKKTSKKIKNYLKTYSYIVEVNTQYANSGYYWKFKGYPDVYLVDGILSYLNKPNNKDTNLFNFSDFLKELRKQLSTSKTISFNEKLNDFNINISASKVIDTLNNERVISVNKTPKTYLYRWLYNIPLTTSVCERLLNKCMDNKNKVKVTKNKFKDFPRYNELTNFLSDYRSSITNSLSSNLSRYNLHTNYASAMKKAGMLLHSTNESYAINYNVLPEHIILAIRDYWKKGKPVKDFDTYMNMYKQPASLKFSTPKENNKINISEAELKDQKTTINNELSIINKEIKKLKDKSKTLIEKEEKIDKAISLLNEINDLIND